MDIFNLFHVYALYFCIYCFLGSWIVGSCFFIHNFEDTFNFRNKIGFCRTKLLVIRRIPQP